MDDEESAAVAARRAQLLDRARIRKVFERRFTARRMAEDYVRIYRSLCRRDALLTAV